MSNFISSSYFNSIIQLLLPMMLFCIDLFSLQLAEQPFFFTVLAYYFVHLFGSIPAYGPLLSALLFLGLESFVITGLVSDIAIMLAPMTLLGLIARRMIALRVALPAFFLIIMICILAPAWGQFLAWQIAANLLALLILIQITW